MYIVDLQYQSPQEWLSLTGLWMVLWKMGANGTTVFCRKGPVQETGESRLQLYLRPPQIIAATNLLTPEGWSDDIRPWPSIWRVSSSLSNLYFGSYLKLRPHDRRPINTERELDTHFDTSQSHTGTGEVKRFTYLGLIVKQTAF